MSPTLRDLLQRGVQFEWFEAVALAQALCQRILERPDAKGGVHVPDLGQILLSEDGEVAVNGEGPESQAPVFRLGEILTTLIGGRPIPVPLRLLVLTAVSPSPPYATVAELSKALDYYERPNRTELLRGVFERYSRMPSQAGAEAVPGEIPALPMPEPVPPKTHWWRQRRLVVAAALLVVVVASGAGLWAAVRSRALWVETSSREARLAWQTTAEAVQRAASSGIQTLKNQLGLATPQPAPEFVGPPAPPPAPRTLKQPTLPVLPTSGSWLRPGNEAAILSPVRSVAGSPVIDVASATSVFAAESEEPVDWTIYSPDNLDVVPPAADYARLPTELPPGVRLEELPLVEVQVSASGEVERVRLRSAWSDVRTSMLLSAIKAWRFQPATRNGHPVRYRFSLRLTGQ